MLKYLKILLTLIFTIILLLGFALPLNPAGNWYQQFMPNIGSKQITDITFLDSLTGFAVASKNSNPDTSSILRTTDGGDSWQIVFTQGSRRFSRVIFINSLTGFISGGSGSGTPYLYKSSDGGNIWNTVPGATLGNAFWNDMSVLNEDTIWLVDANSLNGGVFFTSNGGVNWQPQVNYGSGNPSRIYFFDRNLGFASESTGQILRKTTNSGVNWTTLSTAGAFTDMFFFDNMTGWKTGAPGGPGFRKTTDGGINWFDQTLPSGGNIIAPQIEKLSGLNKDTIYGTGAQIITGSGIRGMINRTTNGGANWTFQVPDSTINIFKYFHIKFVNKSNGWAYNPVTGIHTILGGDPIWLTGITQINSEIPRDYKLYQNYPNPFNPETKIKYQIVSNVKRETTNVKLIVYDIQGKQITELVDQEQKAGIYEVDFNGSNYSSGIYFYSLSADGTVIDTRKMILIK